ALPDAFEGSCTMNMPHASAPPAPAEINWTDLLGKAFLAGALNLLAHVIRERIAEESAEPERASTEEVSSLIDWEWFDAATLLGVKMAASEDEIRAALRSKLASSRLHPDQGGDEEAAKQLIAAKNLLIEKNRKATAARTAR